MTNLVLSDLIHNKKFLKCLNQPIDHPSYHHMMKYRRWGVGAPEPFEEWEKGGYYNTYSLLFFSM